MDPMIRKPDDQMAPQPDLRLEVPTNHALSIKPG